MKDRFTAELRARPLGSVAGLVAVALAFGCTKAPETRPTRNPVGKAATSTRTEPCATLRAAATRLRRGYVKHLAPDISVIPREPNYIGGRTAPPHNAPWKTIANVPLLLYGPGFVRPRGAIGGSCASMADVAPTIAELVGFEGPLTTTGRALNDALVPRPETRPDLVITVVWDGGGWNVLRAQRSRCARDMATTSIPCCSSIRRRYVFRNWPMSTTADAATGRLSGFWEAPTGTWA